VVSPGHIGTQFIQTVHAATASRVVAVASRSAERAARCAQENGIEASFDAVPALLEAGGFDAVYIASPHAQHHDLARPVLEAGYPVLVEKAFTLNAAQARDLLQLAHTEGLFVMEAMWARFLPQYDVLRQVLDAGLLGELVSLRATHSQHFDPDPSHRMFAPELGGGALLDLGVYPVSFAQMVLGHLQDLKVSGTLTDTGVDASAAVVATSTRHPGARALLETTLRGRGLNDAVIVGTEGRAHLRETFFAPSTLVVEMHDGRSAEFTHPASQVAPEWGLAYEAAEAARRITAGDLESPVMSWDDTMAVMTTLDTVRDRLGVVYPGERESTDGHARAGGPIA
jgi:predicted dehydrogenase